MRANVTKASVVLLVAVILAGCAAGRAFHRAERAARGGDWDTAVGYYTKALEAAPDSAEYKIALERAQVTASRQHLAKAEELEAKDDIEGAIREYRKVGEFDPTNRRAAFKAGQLEVTLRERIEAARPKPQIEQMKERARQATPEPILNPASRDALDLTFVANANVRDILNFISQASGINILYDRDMQDRPNPGAIDLQGVTLEQALTIVLTTNRLFYKVLNERTIIVIPDDATHRTQYEEQVIRTFYVSNAEVQELQQLLTGIFAGPGVTSRPLIQPSKTANTITIRGSAALVAIAERVIEANDKPRAEVVIDVEILEVSRTRAKQYGLNLSAYAIDGTFSPEGSPNASSGTSTTTAASNLFNLNTITRGINTADFYLGVPTFQIKALESDSQTKLIAKPSLRGAEGKKLTLNLGDEIPVPSTTFLPLMSGGTAINPSISYNYKPVGVNLSATPRVTYDGDIILELEVESSTKGSDVNVSGQNLPSFGSRKVTTTMRLRDGESNMLAGLLRDDERRSLSGFPGAIHVPILKQLFSSNDNQIQQTDIVMLLTPHIIRSHGLTDRDLAPIYIGTAQSPSLGGPPPLIAAPGEAAAAAPPPAAPTVPVSMQPYGSPGAALVGGAPMGKPTAAGTPVLPPGASPIPGTVMQPPAPPPAQPQPQAVPVQPAPAQPQPEARETEKPAAPALPAAPAAAPARTPTAFPAAPVAAPQAAAQVSATPSGTDVKVGGGPLTVVISASNVNRVSTMSLMLAFNPAVVRVRSVQQGGFMQQGGLNVAFAQQVDASSGRLDITLSRTGDTVGASGSGMLAVVQFDPVAAGTVTFTPSGVANGPGGAVPLSFAPATVTVR